MRVGLGLPNSVPKTPEALLVEWAQHAEAGPFSSVGVVERVAWDCHEPLGVLERAAAVTTRVKLCSMVVIGPLRDDRELAAQAASIDRASKGRLVLGLAVGARLEDYRAAGVEHRGRGRRFDEQLANLRALWESGDDDLRAAGGSGPPVLVGGTGTVGLSRMARWADGYVFGGGPPRAFQRAAEAARAAWIDLGRPGAPRLWAQAYFALGDAAEAGRAFMEDYYAFTGPFAHKIAEGLLTSAQDVVQFLRAYKEAGCDELVLLPATADERQIDRLAAVVVDHAADLDMATRGDGA